MEGCTTKRTGARAGLAILLPLMLLVACSLEVNELPVNSLPVVGSIEMVLPPTHTEIWPADHVEFSVSAEDPELDELDFTWSAQGWKTGDSLTHAVGSWIDSDYESQAVVWIAPLNFSDIDFIRISVRVNDIDQNAFIQRNLEIPVVIRTGSINAEVLNLGGISGVVEVNLGIADPFTGEIIASTQSPSSLHSFDEIPWGNQLIFNYATDLWDGADSYLPDGQTEEVLFGYAYLVYVEPDQTIDFRLTVAPKSLLVVPSVRYDGTHNRLINEIQSGIHYCSDNGLDSLLLRASSFDLEPSTNLPGGSTAALAITDADLTLTSFPGTGIIDLNVSEDCDFGLYMEGRSAATRIENMAIRGADTSGAYLYQSSAVFDTVLVEDCGSAGIFLQGEETDLLSLGAVVLRDNENGLSLSGGRVEAEFLTVDRSSWYGIWLRDGAGGELLRSTVVRSELVGLFTSGAQDLQIAHSLFALNSKGIFNQQGVSPLMDCNLFWANPHGHFNDMVAPGEHLVVDPLFCDEPGGDWRVAAESPALTDPCAPMGARGDCDSVDGPFDEEIQDRSPGGIHLNLGARHED